jgi:hypothetical protein
VSDVSAANALLHAPLPRIAAIAQDNLECKSMMHPVFYKIVVEGSSRRVC